MKEGDVISIVVAAMIVLGFILAVGINATTALHTEADSIADTTSIDTMEENDTMLQRSMDMAMAFAAVESGQNPTAVNGNCVGLLQISPILVQECNRLLGGEYFLLSDREDPYASIAMFRIIMDHHNPTYDIRKACQLWNPTAGEWYYKRVKKALENEL